MPGSWVSVVLLGPFWDVVTSPACISSWPWEGQLGQPWTTDPALSAAQDAPVGSKEIRSSQHWLMCCVFPKFIYKAN